MGEEVTLDRPLNWPEIAAIAHGAAPVLSAEAERRIDASRVLVQTIVARRTRCYGLNTGVGALCDVIIDPERQGQLSRNIVMSHACGAGAALGPAETRAVIAAQVNNFAHGLSGVRLELVQSLCLLLSRDCLPLVPRQGSVGYISHMASVALLLIGGGRALHQGQSLPGGEALRRAGIAPLVLQAKEGLSLINGTPCATGLACIALCRLQRLMAWADLAAAMTYENLGRAGAFASDQLALRRSPGLQAVGHTLRLYLEGSRLLALRAGRTQDPLSLRAIPQVHGAAREAFDHVEGVVDRELESVTDNPALSGSPERPQIHSGAHAVGASLAMAMDHLAVAAAALAAISERRLDRLINPLVSGLPAFLACDSGLCSGFMIAQYSAAALVAENRRLAAPSSLDGGVTSGLQEDFLTHATPAALRVLAVLDNLEQGLAIELLAAAQAYDLQESGAPPAPRLAAFHRRIRDVVPIYADDRPINEDFILVRSLMATPLAPRPV